MAAITCEHLSKSFAAARAVDTVNLRVAEGQFLALLGPSGCGKTTLLRLIAGFEAPDAGSISIDGIEVARPGMLVPPERRRIGMVFQDYALFPHLDVAANVAYGMPRGAERTGAIAELLALVGLAGYERRMPHQLSGGQQQRVALARALAPHPAAILLDEPFSNLDAGLRAEVRAEVRAILRRAGATAVFVTHDQEEALSIADVVAVMRNGAIDQIGPPREIYLRPASREVALFLGDANLLPGYAAGALVRCALGELPLAAPAHGSVEVLIRPEMIRLRPDTSGVPIEQITFFGHDQIVALQIDATPLRARTGPRLDLHPGVAVTLSIDGPVVAFPL
jgi:iron(III) transport system ATP-binding protein